MQWPIRPSKLKTVKTASGKPMFIEGACTVNLTTGNQVYRTNVLTTPDMEGLVLGQTG